ncbi:hypothetical protein DM02DRAFT_340320 [Periconia macrospinosa]|uniref:Uncharacterized protein n=1 Tax=Periconia macrospinosa TaxID=97972 RepID=A0A2V1D0G1_9PLEO|nr:hypothetical protein DM02DRAFT_340320 [Periconia macrospinosa]
MRLRASQLLQLHLDSFAFSKRPVFSFLPVALMLLCTEEPTLPHTLSTFRGTSPSTTIPSAPFVSSNIRLAKLG